MKLSTDNNIQHRTAANTDNFRDVIVTHEASWTRQCRSGNVNGIDCGTCVYHESVTVVSTERHQRGWFKSKFLVGMGILHRMIL